MNEFILCSTVDGDWVGVYINDDIIHQGHSVPTYVWLEIISTNKGFDSVEYFEISNDYIEHIGGHFPDLFSEIPETHKVSRIY